MHYSDLCEAAAVPPAVSSPYLRHLLSSPKEFLRSRDYFSAITMSLMLSDDEELITDHDAAPGASASAAPTKSEAGREETKKLLGGDDDDEDEDFFLTGPRVAPALAQDDRLSGLQRQVREVTDVMRDNVGRMMERGDRLDDLHIRSEQLGAASGEFVTHSTRLRKKMWWQNTRYKNSLHFL